LRFTNRELLYTKQLQKEEEKEKKECILLIAWFKDEVWGGGRDGESGCMGSVLSHQW